MIVAIHCHNGDIDAVSRNMELCAMMDHRVDYTALISYEAGTDTEKLYMLRMMCQNYFKEVRELQYPAPPVRSWPQAPNWVFQQTALHIHLANYKDHWLWWEADAIPLRPQWLALIDDEYRKGGKPFMGHIVEKMGHMNGVGVYPPCVAQYSPTAMFIKRIAWDYVMKQEMIHNCHQANHIFQHVWALDENRQPILNDKYPCPTFRSWEDVTALVDFNHATFHRNKDGTLPDLLMKHYGSDRPCMTKAHVPDHVTKKLETRITPNERSTVKLELFMVTFHRDIQWLELCLRSYEKFCTGFSGVTVVIPESDLQLFSPLLKKHEFTLRTFPEERGKGFLHHEAVVCSADQYVHDDVTHVAMMDPDCIFKRPTRASDFFIHGKPIYIVRTYESLVDAATGAASDCHQWQAVVAKTMGFVPKWYTMCIHPTIFPVDLLPLFRSAVEKVQQRPFLEYVLSCRNEFPQTFAEFPSLGAWAIENAGDRFFWIDCSNGIAGVSDCCQNHWSRGGINQVLGSGRTAAVEIEALLSS